MQSNKFLMFLALSFFLISFTTALPSDSEVDLTFDYPVNYSTIPTVNSSDFWDLLDTPADFLLSMFSNLFIDTDLDMKGNNIDFFGGNVENVSHIQFNPAGNGCTDEFCLEVDGVMGALQYSLPGGNVFNQIGFETYLGGGRIRNTETFTIDNCKAVYLSGATGAIPEVKISGTEKGYRIAQATVGLTTESIASNQQGYVTIGGIVRDCNTSAFSASDGVYLSTNGTLTNIPPTGNGTIFIGTVNRVHATEGEINVLLDKIPSIGDVLYSRNNADGLQIKNISNATDDYDAVPYIQINQTILDLVASIEYNASVISTLTGTVDSGDLSSVLLRDDVFYNVSEVGGTPGFEIHLNYTGVETFNDIVARLDYAGSPVHNVMIELLRCSDSTWVNKYTFQDTGGVVDIIQEILDPTNYICGLDQNVSLRLIHQSSGNPAHDIYIDAIHLVRGATTASPTEVDPLALHKSGDTPMEGNLDMSNFLINNLANGTASTDAVNKGQLDTAIAGVPTSDVNKTYVDAGDLWEMNSGDITNKNGEDVKVLFNNSKSISFQLMNDEPSIRNTHPTRIYQGGSLTAYFSSAGSFIYQNLGMRSKKIRDLAQGTISTDAVNKFQLDQVEDQLEWDCTQTGYGVDCELKKTGGTHMILQENLTIEGDLEMGNYDANVSTLYYDTLTAKSPIFQCSEDWCSVGFPKYQKTLWIQKDENYTILDIVYNDNHYTKQTFWNLVQGTQHEDIALRLNNKIAKLQNKTICKNQGYQWDGECFNIVTSNATYNDAVESYEKEIMNQTVSNCTQLNSQLQVEEVECIIEVPTGEYETIYQFKNNCGWTLENGYECKERMVI